MKHVQDMKYLINSINTTKLTLHSTRTQYHYPFCKNWMKQQLRCLKHIRHTICIKKLQHQSK